MLRQMYFVDKYILEHIMCWILIAYTYSEAESVTLEVPDGGREEDHDGDPRGELEDTLAGD